MYCSAIMRTVIEPSGSTAEPRLLSTNSPCRCNCGRVDGFHIAQGMQHLRDASEHDHRQHHAEHPGHDKEPAALRLVDDPFRNESRSIFVIKLVSQRTPCS